MRFKEFLTKQLLNEQINEAEEKEIYGKGILDFYNIIKNDMEYYFKVMMGIENKIIFPKINEIKIFIKQFTEELKKAGDSIRYQHYNYRSSGDKSTIDDSKFFDLFTDVALQTIKDFSGVEPETFSRAFMSCTRNYVDKKLNTSGSRTNKTYAMILGDSASKKFFNSCELFLAGYKFSKIQPKTKNELKMLLMDNSISLSNIDVSKIDDFSNLFPRSRTNFIGIEHWNTSKVKNMRRCFFRNEHIDQVNLNTWDVSKVENMEEMFADCTNFSSSLSKWNTKNVKNMNRMFMGCRNLWLAGLYNWNVSKVESMRGMFQFCLKFNDDIGGWKTKNVRNMRNMFSNCVSFYDSLEKWDVSNVEDMCGMFNYAKSFVGKNAEKTFNAWNFKPGVVLGFTEIEKLGKRKINYKEDCLCPETLVWSQWDPDA